MKFKYFFIILLFCSFVNSALSLTKSDANKLGKELIKNAKKGNFNLIENFANRNANFNYQDSDGKTILMYALKFKRNDIIKELTNSKFKIDPNLLDEDNKSVLIQAASNSDIDAIKELLKFKNIKINRQGKYGETALDFAYTPRSLYGEQVEYLENFKELPKERKDLIDFLKQHGAKTANQLENNKNENNNS